MAYDDPAVALCEYALKGDLGPLDIYERSSEEIDGARVVLWFTVQVLSTKPKERSVECPFVYDDASQGFVLDVPPPLPTPECAIERAALDKFTAIQTNQGIAPGTPTGAARDRARVALSQCLGGAGFETVRGIDLWQWSRRMRETGIYPIAPDDTGLER